MHDFYRRIQAVFRQAGSNRNQFCKKYGHNYQTLQAYWNTDRLPSGNVLEQMAREYNVALDYLVLGRKSQEIPIENPIVNRLTQFLAQQDDDSLLRIEGAIKMLRYMTLFGNPFASRVDEDGLVATDSQLETDIIPAKIEKVMDMVTRLAHYIQDGSMSRKDKTASKEILNRICMNIFEREVKDQWANLEEIGEDNLPTGPGE